MNETFLNVDLFFNLEIPFDLFVSYTILKHELKRFFFKYVHLKKEISFPDLFE